MSSNVREEPNLTMSARCSKAVGEDGGERTERPLDVDESSSAEHRDPLYMQDGAAHTQRPAVQKERNLLSALILGLLLIVGVIVLTRHYVSIILEKHQLSNNYKELQYSYDLLSNGYCQPQGTDSRTQGNVIWWKRFRCSCYYRSTEAKTWSASRSECQSRGGDLVVINSKEEHDFVKELNKQEASWIGLQSVKADGWWEGQKWRWVDGSTPTYMVWHVGVDLKPADGSTAYMDPEGTMRHTNSGSKRWICETQMHSEVSGNLM
ncbi:C-type lectin domain family 4 member E-like isoform X2 [Chelmon rostratus]|nr:C-type lectin domain family 4 member E-like isoform X2 [Chelmon rostratus]